MASRVMPRVYVELEGAGDDDLLHVARARIRRAFSVPAQCELTIEEPRGPLARGELFFGRRLVVRVDDRPQPVFDGEVTAVEHVYASNAIHRVYLRAYDRLHRLRKRQEVRAYADVSAAALAETLTAELGVHIEAARTGPARRSIIQHRTDDLELLVEEAARAGLYLNLDGDRLQLLGLEGSGTPRRVKLGRELLEASIALNADRAYEVVDAFGWDVQKAETFHAHASTSPAGSNLSAEISQRNTGGSGEHTLIAGPLATSDQAEAFASAELDRSHAARAVLSGVCEGDPALMPGVRLEVEGVAPKLAATYVLSEVIHRIDHDVGFISEISTAPPLIAPRNHEITAIAGIVSAVRDPDGLGRVRARLPAANDVETDWMPICAPGAGGSRGLLATPDVGDVVLILAANGELARGIVLGGLFGAATPADTGVEGSRVARFTFSTATGQKIQLDAGNKVLRIEDGNGSTLIFGPGGTQLSSSVDLVIEAPGKSMKLRASKIGFERA